MSPADPPGNGGDAAANLESLAAADAGVWRWSPEEASRLPVRWPGAEAERDLRPSLGEETWRLVQERLSQAVLDGSPFQLNLVVAGEPGPGGGASGRSLLLRGGRVGDPATRCAGVCWFSALEAASANRDQWVPLAKLGHELRSPLAAVQAQIRQLRQGPESGSRESALARAEASCRYMGQVIEDMLTAFRAGETGAQREAVPIETDALVLQLCAGVAAQVRAKGQAMQVERAADFPDVFLAEMVALRRVLENLLDNAVKYTPEGGAVHLSLRGEESDLGARLVFEVRDTGPGLSREQIARIFTPFERGGADSAGHGGLGIGLALSQQLVAALDGTIEVASEPGRGSRFSVSIPARVSVAAAGGESSEDVSTGAQAGAGSDDGSGMRVLVVDDHRLLCRMTGQALARLGCRVSLANTAAEARRALEDEVPDRIIMDLDLPDQPGSALCAELRQRDDLSGCRFVAYSGSDESLGSDTAHAAGFHAFVLKPADAEALLRA
ncbi:MAG: hybrid sensor histidine kinase/response regulator [Gammaproteobacteria bacterium]